MLLRGLLAVVVAVSALGQESILTACPPGFTGSQCENPICIGQSQPVSHDGEANFGDTVAIYPSDACNAVYTFYVDDFMDNFFISVVAGEDHTYPDMIVSNPAGETVQPCSTRLETEKEKILEYCYTRATHGQGMFSMRVNMQTESHCMIVISAPTKLAIDGGFVSDPQDDYVQTIEVDENEAIGRYPVQGVPSQLAFRMQNDNFPVHPEKVHIYREGQWTQEFDLLARYGCSFPHITQQNFTCSDLAVYHAQFVGIDDGGNQWQRVYTFTCDAAPQTTPSGPVTTPAPQTTCYNNGILTNGVCFCGELFEGEQCEWKVCLHNGTLNVRTSQCLCPAGYTGDYCQHVQCKIKSDDVFGEYSRSLGFVVRSVQSMQAQMGQIAQAFTQITNFYNSKHPGYFQNYVLSIVRKNGVAFTKEFSTTKDFLNSLNNLVTPPADEVCGDALLAGVAEVVDTASFKQYPSSPIFIFSDGVTNDNQATMVYLYQQLGITRPQLFFMLSDSLSGTCNIDQTSEGYQNLLALSSFTQGHTVKTDVDHLAQSSLAIATTLWRPAQMATNDFMDCKLAPKYQPFFVDESMTTVYISATGDNLTLSLVKPDMTMMQPVVAYYSGNLHIWTLNDPATGPYMVNLNSAVSGRSECSYRVYSDSHYNLYYASSSDLLTDSYSKQPIWNQASHLVARMDNVPISDPIEVSTEITLWYNDPYEGRKILYSSSGIWRDDCQYDLYFDSFVCTVPLMGFYANVYLTDASGQTVLRTTTGYCATALPPPPDEVCQNGGALANGTCVCPSHFIGSKCEITNCENQGTPLFGACKCPPGFDGQFCEITACFSFNPNVNINFNYRSLTFMMHDTMTTRSALRTINDVASRVVQDIVHQHPKWLSNYQLLRFNDTDFSTMADGSDPQAFVDGIAALYASNQKHSDFSCANLDLYATILNAVQDKNVAYGGMFYIFLFGTARPDSDSYDKILTHVQNTGIQINVVQLSLVPCGHDITSDGLISLTQVTGGTYYLSSSPNAGNVLKSLPTQYQSGSMYQKYVANCSDYTFYLPVDAGTQSLTTYIQGSMNFDPIYMLPNGSVATGIVSNVWNDIGSDSRMDQLIRSCDDGWTLSDGHCWMFMGSMAKWQVAKTACAGVGASLGTVYNKAEQAFLDSKSYNSQFWIGLNDIDNLSVWVWDAANNLTLTLNSTQYTHWAANEPTADPSKRCVLDDNSVDISSGNGQMAWVTADCEEKHSFVCVKNNYNTEFEPENLDENDLPRGVWAVRVQADGGCSLNARAQSLIQVVPMYTSNVHSDIGSAEPIKDSDTNRVIAHVTGLLSSTQHSLEYAHLYSNDGALIAVQNMVTRDSCMFNYMSTPFHCPADTFQMLLTGVDTYGNLYQRIVPVNCIGGAKEDACENGGKYYQGTCICPPMFYGDTCEIAFCENGGMPTASLSQCSCPPLFQGQFCEIPRCSSMGDVPDLNPDGKTFVVVIDGSSTGDMATVINDIANTLATVIRNVQTSHDGWFTQYVGVIVRDSAYTGAQISSLFTGTVYTDWIADITNELTTNPYTSTTKARLIFQGLSKALIHPSIKDESLAFVVTNSAAEDYQSEDLLQTIVATSHSSISMLFIGDKTAPGGFSYSDPQVNELFEAAHYSGGSVYQLSSPKGLADQWSQILGSMHHSYYVISHHITNCSSYQDYIQLGTNATEMFVDLFAQSNPTIVVKNTDGEKEQALTIVGSATNNLLQFTQDSHPGIWTVSLDASGKNTGTCMFNIRGMSDLEVNVAFTQDVQTDGGMHDGSAVAYPKAGYNSNAVVASLTGVGVLTTVEIFDVEERTLIWASSLVPRALCSYSYWSLQTFRCDRPTFILAVDGLDAVGHPFRRMFTFHCQGLIVTPAPTVPAPATWPVTAASTTTLTPLCDPAVPKADLVVVFDSSDELDPELFQQMVGEFRDLANNFQIGATQMRTLIGTYDVDAQFNGDDLNTINSTSDYAIRIAQLAAEGYTGNIGNNIDDVLRYLVNVTHTATPFRADARKILVIVSSIGWDRGNFYDNQDHGFADPTDHANALKAQSVEFYPIAFGVNANVTQLSALSSKCLQKAMGMGDIRGIVRNISLNICQTTPQC